MRKLKWSYQLILAVCFIITGCDLTIHTYPEFGKLLPIEINLEYDTDLPLYKTVDYTKSEISDALGRPVSSSYNYRYIIEGYRVDGLSKNISTRDGEADFREIFTGPANGEFEISKTLLVAPGSYDIFVWTDYANGESNTFYNADNFKRIKFEGEWVGSCDFKDAFRGKNEGVDALPDVMHRETTIEMTRPLARYEIITEDVDEFLTKAMEIRREKEIERYGYSNIPTKSEDDDTKSTVKSLNDQLSTFNIVVRYQGYVPNTYSLASFKPTDSAVNVTFNSNGEVLTLTDALMGYDYVFVNGGEGRVDVELLVYDNDGTLLSRSGTIQIPLVRSKTTIIRGCFLTKSAGGGLSINTEFEGDFNICIK